MTTYTLPTWQVRDWGDRLFTFLRCAGSWRDNFQRVAHECKVQRLLTPTWEDPHFPHLIESEATEYGWNLQPEGDNATQCYRWM